jgi:hypothetical protein
MRALVTRVAIMLVSLVVAAVGMATSFVFFCFALYAALCSLLSPALAALASGAIVFISTVFIVLIANALGRAMTRRRLSDNPIAAGRALGAMFARQFQSFSAKNPGASLLMALFAGFVSGANPSSGS